MGSKGGAHGDVVYKFEDNGFASAPSDTTFKVFGGNVTMDTYEGSHEAIRVFNADRKAAEIIEQVFDGAWSITGELGAEPPWWFQAVWGSPTSTETATTGLYDHDYSLSSGGDPETLQLYMPTDGFTDYEVLYGCAVATLTIDQSQPNSPEFTLSGAYAKEPQRESTETISIPTFAESTFNNRMADVTVDGTRVAKAQTHQLEIQTGIELVGEIGSGEMVDYVPRAFEPNPTYDKIVSDSQSVDLLNRFKNATSVTVNQDWNNGATGTDEYGVSVDLTGSFPNSWSETGRNDPDADLMQELQDMAEDATATITVDTASPPT